MIIYYVEGVDIYKAEYEFSNSDFYQIDYAINLRTNYEEPFVGYWVGKSRAFATPDECLPRLKEYLNAEIELAQSVLDWYNGAYENPS